jgi:maltose/moltooligosaccharide transporter
MKLNYRRTFFIGLAFLSISAFWQVYDNIIPLILQNTFGLKETVTGALMAMDNVLAIFLLPLFGTLSDRVDTKLGKRTPFILGGTIVAVILTLLLAMADRNASLPLFIGTLFCLLIAMGTYRSPAVALMPDLTPNVVRSKANAVINLMGALGAVYALIMIRLLSGRTDAATGRTDYFPLFFSIIAVMIVAVAVLLLTIRENRIHAQVEQETADYEAVHGKFIPDEEEETCEADESAADPSSAAGPSAKKPMAPEVKRSMAFLLLSIFLWFTAYNAVTTAFSRYVGKVWGMQGGGYATCLLVATLAAVVSYIPIGQLSEKFGRKKMILAGIVLMSVCYFTAIFANHFAFWINILFALIGIGWASINVNSYPMVVAMSRGADIGKFTGTYYTFSMAAQIMTPVLSGFLLEHVSYRTLFPYAFAFSILALLTMLQVKHGDVIPEAAAGAAEET